MLNIGWFSTGRDEAACQLLAAAEDAIERGDIEGRISFVFSNREPGEAEESDRFFRLVNSYGLPLVTLSSRRFRGSLTNSDDWRRRFDEEVDRLVRPYSPDVCMMAGYMLIMSEVLPTRYTMINVHPAPPGGPRGTWQEVMWQLIDGRAENAGAMVNLVVPELDAGPPITYFTFGLRGEEFDPLWQSGDREELFRRIREKELAGEFPLMLHTLAALGRGEIRIQEGAVYDAAGNPVCGYDLSDRVLRAIGS
ncbi:MAG: phosphoribosylglycinamide formyltransferase [Chloroflexota bacterium]